MRRRRRRQERPEASLIRLSVSNARLRRCAVAAAAGQHPRAFRHKRLDQQRRVPGVFVVARDAQQFTRPRRPARGKAAPAGMRAARRSAARRPPHAPARRGRASAAGRSPRGSGQPRKCRASPRATARGSAAERALRRCPRSCSASAASGLPPAAASSTARLRHALRAQPRQGLRRRRARRAHALAAAAHRRQQVLRVAAGQHEAQAAGRLLERLQQGVGGGRVHAPRPGADHQRAPARGPALRCVQSMAARTCSIWISRLGLRAGCAVGGSSSPSQPSCSRSASGTSDAQVGVACAAHQAAGDCSGRRAASLGRLAQPGLRQRQRQLELARRPAARARSSACDALQAQRLRQRRVAARAAAGCRRWQRPRPWAHHQPRRLTACSTCAHTASRAAARIDAHEALRCRRARARVAGAHALEEGLVLRSKRSGARAAARRRGRRCRGPGRTTASGRAGAPCCTQRFELRQHGQVEAAAAALVGEGGVGEAVAQHRGAARQRRLDAAAAGGRAAPRTPAGIRSAHPSASCSTSSRSCSASGVPPGSRVTSTVVPALARARRPATRCAWTCRRRRCPRR